MSWSLQIQGALAERAIDGRGDAVARELALLAQEPHDAVEIGLERPHVERVGDVGREIDAPYFVDQRGIAERLANRRGHALDPPVFLHQLQRLLGSDAADAV